MRIILPPLLDRPEGIPVLVSHICQKFACVGHKPPTLSNPRRSIPDEISALAIDMNQFKAED